MEVLSELSVTFPDTKDFINEKFGREMYKRKYIVRRGNLFFIALLCC